VSGLIVGPAPSAVAAPGSADIGAANKKLQGMEGQMATAQKNYQASAQKLAQARIEAANSRKELKALNARIEANRHALNDQANYLYRTGNASFLEAMFSSQSFEEFFSRITYLSMVSDSNARVIGGLRADLSRHTAVQANLDKQLRAQETETASLKRQNDQFTQDLASQQAYVNGLSAAQQASLEAAAQQASAQKAAQSGPKPNNPPQNGSGTGMTFSGIASWYDYGSSLTAAHKTLPFGTLVRVTYRGRSIVVRINDRGPYVAGRVIDLNRPAAEAIGMKSAGVGYVTCEVLK